MNELFKYNSSKQEYLLNAINEYLEMEEFDSAIEFIICNIILKFGAVNINTETKEVMVCE